MLFKLIFLNQDFTGLISRTWEVVVDPNGDPLRNTMDLSVKDDSMQLDAQVLE